MTRALCCAAASLLLQAACGGGGGGDGPVSPVPVPPAPVASKLAGTVVRSDNALPVAGAVVFDVGGLARDTTEADGSFLLQFQVSSRRTARIIGSRLGFGDDSADVTLDPGLTTTHTVRLRVHAASPVSVIARRFERTVRLEETSANSANVSVGDLDGDGDLDIVLAKGRHTPLHNRVLLNNGLGEFPVARDLGATADRSYSTSLADLDGDADLDVVVSNDRPDPKAVYVNDGGGNFTRGGSWGDSEWPTRNATVADLNGDGRPDIIAANRPGPSYFCLNDGKGGFPRDRCTAIGSSAAIIVAGDFNGDSFIDLAVPHRDGGQSLVYFNDGKAGFASSTVFASITSARAATAGDFDGDGKLDLVVGDDLAAQTFVYLNSGGSFAAPFIVGPGGVPYSLAAADMNRDGTLDIVIGTFFDHARSVLFNDGTGRSFSFTRVSYGDTEGAVYGLALGDLNGDGFPDIAAARTAAVNVLYISGAP